MFSRLALGKEKLEIALVPVLSSFWMNLLNTRGGGIYVSRKQLKKNTLSSNFLGNGNTKIRVCWDKMLGFMQVIENIPML